MRIKGILSTVLRTAIEWNSSAISPLANNVLSKFGIKEDNYISLYRIISLITIFNVFLFSLSFEVYSKFTVIYQLMMIILSNIFIYIFQSKNPGYVEDLFPKSKMDEYGDIPKCNLCENIQPMRSVHCRKCGHCILRMDHHNSFFNRCIGAYNIQYYAVTLFFIAFGSISISSWCFDLLFFYQATVSLKLYIAICLIIYTPLSLDVMCIFISTVLKIFVNITTFELNNRCTYMIKQPKMYNPFDHGMDNNAPECLRKYENESKLWTKTSYLNILESSSK